MPQEDLKPNDKSNFPRFRPRGDDENGSKKGPKFSIYWVWGVIAALLIGFNLFGSFSPDPHPVDELTFRRDMLARGDVDKIDLISNKQLVRVYIKKDSLQRAYYTNQLKNNGLAFSVGKDAPQFEFKVTDVKEYEKTLRDFFVKNPQLEIAVNSKSEGEWFGPLLNFLLPLLIIVLIWVMLMRKMGGQGGTGGPGGIFNIGKSKATLFDKGTKVAITFNDVAGLDEAKVEVMEIVDFLKNPKKYTALGGKIPKGALLIGPPGTGKTLLAKAVAGEAEVPFFSVSGSDFVEMFVGVGASRVRDMFEQGRKSAPCIIFIDEIDAVGRQRGAGLGGGNDEREQTLNSILVEMDGFDTSEGVIIIAATNRPDVLDSALLRPGRFDRQIYVDLPDILGREQILRVHARKLSLGDNVDLGVIARGTPGLSGAELANLLNEAALLAARRNRKKIDALDVEDAREKVQFGRERRRLMDDEEKKLTAYHEAGHALIQAVLDDGHMPVHKVTIIPRGRSLGSTMFIPKKDVLTQAMKRMLNQIAMGLGGRVAEELVLNDISSGAAGDIIQITAIARHMVCDWGMSPLGPIAYGGNHDTVFLGRDITRTENVSEETARRIDVEIQRIISEQFERAKKIIGEHRSALDKIAEALLEHETLEGRHVLEILEFGEIRSPIAAAFVGKILDKPEEKKAADKQATSEGLGA